MLALTLPDGEAEKRRARRAVAALARRFGQAATYEMEPLRRRNASPSGWSLRVVPCFPGLEAGERGTLGDATTAGFDASRARK